VYCSSHKTYENHILSSTNPLIQNSRLRQRLNKLTSMFSALIFSSSLLQAGPLRVWVIAYQLSLVLYYHQFFNTSNRPRPWTSPTIGQFINIRILLSGKKRNDMSLAESVCNFLILKSFNLMRNEVG
jgi:hypothetical protein